MIVFLDICEIFKMCIDGVASGVNLVKKWQPSGDLENVWIIFYHFKCVKGSTTNISYLQPCIL